MFACRNQSPSTDRSSSGGRDESLWPLMFPAAFLRSIAGAVESATVKGRTEKVFAYVHSNPWYDIASRTQFHYTYRPVGKHFDHHFTTELLEGATKVTKG